jgi:hypothetical protein
MPEAAAQFTHPCEVAEARRNDIPDFLFDLLNRSVGIDYLDAIRLVRRKFAVGGTDGFIKVGWFLFHPVDSGGRTNTPHYAPAGGFDIDIKEKREIRPALADRERVQAADHFIVQASGNPLVNGGGIGETIGNNHCATVERGLNDFAYELTAASFKEEQLSLRHHGHAFWDKLQEMANPFTDRGSARFARHKEGHVGVRHAGGQQTHLSRFSAALGAFEGNERQARHVIDFQANRAACRISTARLVFRRAQATARDGLMLGSFQQID